MQYTVTMLSRCLLAICLLVALTASAHAGTPSPSQAGAAQSFPLPPIRAQAAVVMDASNGTVLAARNPHLRLPMASTTKIMTALIALKLGNLNDRITVPSAAFNFESDATVMGLHPGQVVTLRDLLYGLMLPSGADAANTIALHYGGSIAHFVTLMNGEAADLGLTDTHFVDAHGLDSVNHYTSAYDLANLAQYVSYIPDLIKITATRTYRWNGQTLTNLNQVLFWYPGVDGIKPGYINASGICQVLDARRFGRHVVVAILNTPDVQYDARNLLNFGLHSFSWVPSPAKGDNPGIAWNGQDQQGPFTFFLGSGHYVRQAFQHAYSANGGPNALGFPRTEALTENGRQVQYFQNGALARDPKTGAVTRLALGLTPLPTATPLSTHTITPTATATAAGTVTAGSVTATGTPLSSPTAIPPTSTPTPEPRRLIARARAGTPTPVPTRPVPVASVFAAFAHSHQSLLGAPAHGATSIRGYTVQLFTYGGLIYDPHTRSVELVPMGDRLLTARGYLPAHPGDHYPQNFAPAAVVRRLGWLPSG